MFREDSRLRLAEVRPSDVRRCVLHKRDYPFRCSSHTSSGMVNGDIYDPFTTISFILSSFHGHYVSADSNWFRIFWYFVFEHDIFISDHLH